MLSSSHTKVPVLISIISGEVCFNHNWRSTCSTTAGEICVPSQIPGRQELLPLQLVNCFFHCRWSSTFSITPGQCLFHNIWSGQVHLPLQLLK